VADRRGDGECRLCDRGPTGRIDLLRTHRPIAQRSVLLSIGRIISTWTPQTIRLNVGAQSPWSGTMSARHKTPHFGFMVVMALGGIHSPVLRTS